MSAPVRRDSGAPKVHKHSAPEQQGPRQAAVAGERYNVVQGDTLWRIAEEAYGDGNKWPLIRDANKNKIKMRGDDIALIGPGMKLDIPAAPQGWQARAPRAPEPQAAPPPPPAPATTESRPEAAAPAAPAAPSSAAEASTRVYGEAAKAFDNIENQLKGMPGSMREALAKGLSGDAQLPPQLEGLAKQVEQLGPKVQQLLGTLPEKDQGGVADRLEQDNRWPLTNQLLDALNTPETPGTSAAPKAPAAPAVDAEADKLTGTSKEVYVTTQTAFDTLEKKLKELPAKDLAMLEKNLAAGVPVPKELQGHAAMAVAVKDLVQQQFKRLSGAEQEKLSQLFEKKEGWDLSGRIQDALEKGLERSPKQVAGMPQAPNAPRLAAAVQQTVLDGRLELRELAGVLRAMAQDAKDAARQAPAVANAAREQAMKLMDFLSKQALVSDPDRPKFARIANDLNAILAKGAPPDSLEAIAAGIEAGKY